jgi:hypothetical protein
MVQSIPRELSLEETAVLTAASNQELGKITITLLIEQLGWVIDIIIFFYNKKFRYRFAAGQNFVQNNC